ncbi:MAG: hypothetical protein HYX90_10845 [Chloroflexi bacterium]|nr:hypothetical protein [Chloroflexota bacterium]
MTKARNKIHSWQIMQDKRAIQTETYRYAIDAIVVETEDEQICAQHLLHALMAATSGDFASAKTAMATAMQLTPAWWEIFTIQARILELENRPIYEIEEPYDRSIRCKRTDINLYHYSTYLLRNNEFVRALDAVEEALKIEGALVSVLKSIKGLALVRLARIPEAIAEFEDVHKLDAADTIPVHTLRTHGTQLADAYRRRADQLFTVGQLTDGHAALEKGARLVDETIGRCRVDHVLAEVAIDIVNASVCHTEATATPREPIRNFCIKYDNNEAFLNACQSTTFHIGRVSLR